AMLGCAVFVVTNGPSLAQSPRPPIRREPVDAAVRPAATEAPSREPSPREDDAQLHDIQFVSSRLGWAVGDHGVIWHTRDGGAHWELQTSNVTCTLSSVCFLTDRVGWAAGGATMPFTRLSSGVLLQTTDGGKSWRSLLASPQNRAVPTRSGKSKVNEAETAKTESETGTFGEKTTAAS